MHGTLNRMSGLSRQSRRYAPSKAAVSCEALEEKSSAERFRWLDGRASGRGAHGRRR